MTAKLFSIAHKLDLVHASRATACKTSPCGGLATRTLAGAASDFGTSLFFWWEWRRSKWNAEKTGFNDIPRQLRAGALCTRAVRRPIGLTARTAPMYRDAVPHLDRRRRVRRAYARRRRSCPASRSGSNVLALGPMLAVPCPGGSSSGLNRMAKLPVWASSAPIIR